MLPHEFVAKVEAHGFAWKKEDGQFPGISIYQNGETTFFSRLKIAHLAEGALEKELEFLCEGKTFVQDWNELPANSWEAKDAR